MGFEKRELLLIFGVLLLMIGLMAIFAPIYSLLIAIAVYFGIRIFVGRRRKEIEKTVGQGVCMTCGSKIEDKRCPICDDATN